MKNLIIIFLLIACFDISIAQLPHQPMQPPVNPGYPFHRGMYVDCAGDIINDMVNGNHLGLEQELIDYIARNYINYIVLCDLENAQVFGKHGKENILRKLIADIRVTVQGIQIAIGANPSAFANASPVINIYNESRCFPQTNLASINDVESIVNYSASNASSIRTAELCKFIHNAGRFGKKGNSTGTYKKCQPAFDGIVIMHRYWEHTASLNDMRSEFDEFIRTLSVVNYLKCLFPCFRFIDAEFLPSDMFRLQGWTAIDQITEADPLASRLIIPAHADNPNTLFDQVCKTLHFLTDRFSKPRTEIFIGLSAESPAFTYCSSMAVPHQHLGNFLNGTAANTGNMYAAEKTFLDKFNDTNYMCSACSCLPYAENHYNDSNVFANYLSGAVWQWYSMMNDNSLSRKKQHWDEPVDVPIKYNVIDINGRILRSFNAGEAIEFPENYNGIYFLQVIMKNGNVIYKKSISIKK